MHVQVESNIHSGWILPLLFLKLSKLAKFWTFPHIFLKIKCTKDALWIFIIYIFITEDKRYRNDSN